MCPAALGRQQEQTGLCNGMKGAVLSPAWHHLEHQACHVPNKQSHQWGKKDTEKRGTKKGRARDSALPRLRAPCWRARFCSEELTSCSKEPGAVPVRPQVGQNDGRQSGLGCPGERSGGGRTGPGLCPPEDAVTCLTLRLGVMSGQGCRWGSLPTAPGGSRLDLTWEALGTLGYQEAGRVSCGDRAQGPCCLTAARLRCLILSLYRADLANRRLRPQFPCLCCRDKNSCPADPTRFWEDLLEQGVKSTWSTFRTEMCPAKENTNSHDCLLTPESVADCTHHLHPPRRPFLQPIVCQNTFA